MTKDSNSCKKYPFPGFHLNCEGTYDEIPEKYGLKECLDAASKNAHFAILCDLFFDDSTLSLSVTREELQFFEKELCCSTNPTIFLKLYEYAKNRGVCNNPEAFLYFSDMAMFIFQSTIDVSPDKFVKWMFSATDELAERLGSK